MMATSPDVQYTIEDGNIKNYYKWQAIPRFHEYLLPDETEETLQLLEKKLFETPVSMSQKLDGLCVGIDDQNTIYDNDQIISHAGTEFDAVAKIDVVALRNSLVQKELGIDAELIEKFVLYGELMCTESNFD